MKKLRKFLKELRMARYSILEILAYVITGGWFAYVVAIISASDSGILGKVFFVVWSLVLVFLFLIYKCNNNKD